MTRLRFTIALLFLVTVVGCAHLGSLDQTVYDLTEQIVTDTEQLHAKGVITLEQFRAASLAENRIAVAGSAFNKLVRAGTAKPTDGVELLRAVRASVTQLKTIAGGPFAKVLEKLTQLDSVVSKFMGPSAATVY